MLEESPDLSPGSWIPSPAEVTVVGANHHVLITPITGTRFFRLRHP
jgi:hypothetical protein